MPTHKQAALWFHPHYQGNNPWLYSLGQGHLPSFNRFNPSLPLRTSIAWTKGALLPNNPFLTFHKIFPSFLRLKENKKMHIPYLETFLWCLLEPAERAEVWKLVSGKETVSSGAREQAALGGKWWDQPLKAGKLQTKCAQQYFPLCSSFILKMKIARDKSIGLIPGTVCSLLSFFLWKYVLLWREEMFSKKQMPTWPFLMQIVRDLSPLL